MVELSGKISRSGEIPSPYRCWKGDHHIVTTADSGLSKRMWRTFSRTLVKVRAVTATTRTSFVQFFAFHSLANKENPSRFESSYQEALRSRVWAGETFFLKYSLIDSFRSKIRKVSSPNREFSKRVHKDSRRT
jgi:hypothetical protein